MENSSETREWYTIKDACNYLQISQMTIFRWMKSGKITFFKMGGSVRFKQEHLDMVGQKSTGSAEADIVLGRCSVCGNSEMVEGKVQGTGRLYFRPQKTKFLVMKESMVPVASCVCTTCGHLQMFAETGHLNKLLPEKEQEDKKPKKRASKKKPPE